MEKWKSVVRWIETVNDIAGRVFSFLLLPLMFITALEVIMRYGFNSPTIWAWDTNVQLFSLIILFGGGYCYRYDMHVRVDLLIINLSLKWRTIMNLVTSVLFFFGFSILLVYSTLEAMTSFAMREHHTSFWEPPIWPLKMIIPVGVFLFILQGVAYVIRDIIIITHPEERAK